PAPNRKPGPAYSLPCSTWGCRGGGPVCRALARLVLPRVSIRPPIAQPYLRRGTPRAEYSYGPPGPYRGSGRSGAESRSCPPAGNPGTQGRVAANGGAACGSGRDAAGLRQTCRGTHNTGSGMQGVSGRPAAAPTPGAVLEPYSQPRRGAP